MTRRHPLLRWTAPSLLLAVSTTALPGGAQAPDTPVRTPDPLAGAPATLPLPSDTVDEPIDTFALPAVVVTATRVPLDREALPTPVTVLTGRELRASGVRTVADALRQVPGATVVRSGPIGAQTSLFLRGGESDYVQVLIDGVNVNDPGDAFDFANLSLDQVERIEVVRGPVSVLYGSDAVAGVVQVFTRRGSGAPIVTAEVTGGRGEQRRGSEDGYATYDAEVGLAGAAGPVTYAIGGTGNLRLGWRVRPGAEISLTSRVTDGRYHFPTDGTGAIVDANAFLDRTLWTTAIQAGLQLHERVDAQFQLATVSRRQSTVDRPDGPDDTEGTFAYTLDFDGTRRLADARVNARLPGTVVTAGIDWESAEATTDYASRSAFGPFDAAADFERATTGYYLQALASPFDRLHLTLGGRVDDSESYGTFTTHRVGAALELTAGTRVRGALGRAFREPTFAEAFGSGFGDRGNAALEPEQSSSWEMGLEQEVGPAVLAATWFDQRYDQLIQFTFAPPSADDPNYFNIGEARARGLELEARAASGPWSATASYSWLETEVLDPGLASDASFAEGESLLRRPGRSGSVTGHYAFQTATVSITVNAVGEREDLDFSGGFPAPRITLPAYATVDLAGSYTLPFSGPATELLVRVENALDADYQAIAGFPAPGRVARLGARLRVGR